MLIEKPPLDINIKKKPKMRDEYKIEKVSNSLILGLLTSLYFSDFNEDDSHSSPKR